MPYKDPVDKKAWSQRNKARVTAASRRYRLAHPDAVKQQKSTHRQANSTLLKEYDRRYREQNRAAIQAFKKIWKRVNSAKVAAQKARWRAQKRLAPVNDLTHSQWLEIQEAQDHKCYYCGKRYKGKLTQDHIIPLSKGGSHTLHNVIAACNTCNAKKNVGPPLSPVQPLLLTLAPAKRKKIA